MATSIYNITNYFLSKSKFPALPSNIGFIQDFPKNLTDEEAAINSSSSTNELSEEEVEENIENGKYIAPYEYKSSGYANVSSSEDAYKKVVTSTKYMSNKYFWCEDLKNWCTYVYYTDCPCAYSVYYEWHLPNQTEWNVATSYGVEWSYSYWINPATNQIERMHSFAGYYSDGINKYRYPYTSWYKYCGINSWVLYVWNGIDSFVPIENLKMKSCEVKLKQDSILDKLSQLIIYNGWYKGDKSNTSYPEYDIKYIRSSSGGYLTEIRLAGDYVLKDAKNSEWTIDDREKDFTADRVCTTATSNGWLKNYYYKSPGNINEGYYPLYLSPYQQNSVYPIRYLENIMADDLQAPLNLVQGFKLKKQTKYTILDSDNAQCMRVSKSVGYAPFTCYDASNMPQVRQGVPCGNPALIRANSGDLILSTTLIWSGTWGMMGTENSSDVTDFLNDICIRFFGDGSNKTIANDWLIDGYNNDTSKEIATTLADIHNADDETLSGTLVSQNNLTSDKKCKMTFNTNDINISVDNPVDETYVAAKW